LKHRARKTTMGKEVTEKRRMREMRDRSKRAKRNSCVRDEKELRGKK